MSSAERYVPAAGRAWLTSVYDPAMALTMRERTFRAAVITAALESPRPQIVLDVGCGTGTLAAALARADGALEVLGVDGDERVLASARAKNSQAGERIKLIRAMADELPIEDASIDVAVASLLLHHLPRDTKLRTLRETRRVLRPAGRLVVADWGQPHDPLMRAAFFVLQLVNGFQNTREHAAGHLPSLIAQAGFHTVSITQRWRTLWGSLDLIVAHKTI